MPRGSINATPVPELPVAKALEGEVEGWRNQGWSSGVTETTRELLRYLFQERGDADE